MLGTPLGVCVNCVAPIAKSIYEAGSKMELASVRHVQFPDAQYRGSHHAVFHLSASPCAPQTRGRRLCWCF